MKQETQYITETELRRLQSIVDSSKVTDNCFIVPRYANSTFSRRGKLKTKQDLLNYLIKLEKIKKTHGIE